jgi:hypothetical protein
MLEVAITAFEQVLNFEQGQQLVTETTHVVATKDGDAAVAEPILTTE